MYAIKGSALDKESVFLVTQELVNENGLINLSIEEWRILSKKNLFFSVSGKIIFNSHLAKVIGLL